jgi:hypothetical protein
MFKTQEFAEESEMKYRHYKGGIYQMVCEAHLEAEPNVMMVVYKSSDGTIWTRPKQVFFEEVMHEGRLVPRFAPIV